MHIRHLQRLRLRDTALAPLAAAAFIAMTLGLNATRANDQPASGEATAAVEAFADGNPGAYTSMDYGPVIAQSVALEGFDAPTIRKALGIRVKDDACLVFDTDTLSFAAGGIGGWLDITRTDLAAPKGDRVASLEGEQVTATRVGPGWATPEHGFADPRERGLGNLPRSWGRYGGYHRHGDAVVLRYEVFGTQVLDLPGAIKVAEEQTLFTRQITVAAADASLIARIMDVPGDPASVDVEADRLHVQVGEQTYIATLANGADQAQLQWDEAEQRIELLFPAAGEERSVTLAFGRAPAAQASAVMVEAAEQLTEPRDPATLLDGGPTRWPEQIHVSGKLGEADAGYVVDDIPLPQDNPWGAWMRPTGFDFFADGDRAAVSTVNGDVWIVTGLDDTLQNVQWKRFASGLFYPMGVVVGDDETIYVTERSQLTRLHDLDGDGEADFYENFNNDGYLHPKAHALTLHRDDAGDFYFFRNGNRVPGDLPDHGRLMRVSADGERREAFAHGFRGANGMGIADDGAILAGDQEGNWVPATRIDRVEQGGFYGYRPHGGQDLEVGDYERPIMWLPRRADASAGEQAWVADERWGPVAGRWAHTSYSHSTLHLLFYEEVDGRPQGGAVRLPLEFSSGLMRARFNRAGDGQLYVMGLGSWGALFAEEVGCFNRVRYVGGEVNLPKAINVSAEGLLITFTDPLDDASAADITSYQVERWNYRYTDAYGSAQYSVADPDEPGRDAMQITGAYVSDDGRQVLLRVDDLKPVMQMRIGYALQTASGETIENEIHHTVHHVPETFAETELAFAPADAQPGDHHHHAEQTGDAAAAMEADGDELAIPAAMAEAEQAVEADPAIEPVEIRIEGDDQMQFDIGEFTVPSGHVIELTFVHTGVLPLEAMGHNVVILEQGVDPLQFGFAASEVGSLANHYVPGPVRDQVLAYTDMVGGGDSVTIRFIAPEPGEHAYVCSFPGHFATMRGTMIVE